ncbi:hypothetical protein [Thiolapillus sp.]|uniref:hypothetical protein n=1 Tax=Thiolapillus sp. TaxID=2017437 RepID=UPI003AF7A1FB
MLLDLPGSYGKMAFEGWLNLQPPAPSARQCCRGLFIPGIFFFNYQPVISASCGRAITPPAEKSTYYQDKMAC